MEQLSSKEYAESLFKAKSRIQQKYGIPVKYNEVKLEKVESGRIIFRYNSDIVAIIDRKKQEEDMFKQIKRLQKESFLLGALTGGFVLSAGSLIDAVITNDPFTAGLSLIVGLGIAGVTAITSRKCMGIGAKEFSGKAIELAKDMKEEI